MSTAQYSEIYVQRWMVQTESLGGGTTSPTIVYDTNYEHTVTADPAAGYEFVSWSDGGEQTHVVYGDHANDNKLIATFKKQSVSVKYYVSQYMRQFDEVIHEESLTPGSTPTTYTPTRSGVTFAGWNPVGSAPAYGQPITSDAEYTATWTASMTFSTTSKLPFTLTVDSLWEANASKEDWFGAFISQIKVTGTITHNASPNHVMGLTLTANDYSELPVEMATTTITAKGSTTQTVDQTYDVSSTTCGQVYSWTLDAVKETECSVTWKVNLVHTFSFY